MEDPRAQGVRDGYARIARAYADELSNELAAKPLDRAFLTAFAEQAPPGRIADVGCGPGQVGAFVARCGRDVIGYDLSPEMVTEARARHPALTFEVGDLFALPVAHASLAGIVAFYAIVHLQPAELGRAFATLADRLAAGGLLALAFHVGDETVHVDELFGCRTSLDFVFHSPARVIAALADAGMTVTARLDRQPYAGAEHASERCYLLARR